MQQQIARKIAVQQRKTPQNAEYSFVIKLPPVTKKNSQRMAKRGTQIIPLPSKAYTEYQECAGAFLKPLGIDYPVEITCLFYMKTRRRVDLVNLLEAADDVLAHYGVIADDNSRIVVSHDGSRVFYDKENPRTEISIRKVQSET